MAEQLPPADGARTRLAAYVNAIESLNDEKGEVGERIKAEFAAAKGDGFDVKALREVLKLRRMKPHDRAEQRELLEVYAAAVGLDLG